MASRRGTANWDDYRYFLAVARVGTLSAAAEQLDTEHTTVARHIQSLEATLQTRLFHKSNAGYALTPEGQRVLRTAEAIETASLQSQSSSERQYRDLEGVVRIGAPDGFGSMFLTPRLHELLEQHPKLEIEVLAAPRIFSLWKREADIAISLSRAVHMRVASRRLTDYRLFVYGARSYLERNQPIRGIEDLERHPFSGYAEQDLYMPELNYFANLGPRLQPRIRSSALLPQIFATLDGHALGILPAYMEATFPELQRVLPDEISLTRSFHLHVHEDHRDVAHIRVVANFVASVVQSHRGLFMGER
ncbi:LysR substrate-binding domain-containing protein [soil metagenome]